MSGRSSLPGVIRNPRLVRCMQFAACLSSSEAVDCLRAYRAGSLFAGEAVNHFGGVQAVVAAAVRCRGVVARQDQARLRQAEERLIDAFLDRYSVGQEMPGGS